MFIPNGLILDQFKPYCFLTGSQAFGIATGDSDYDYCYSLYHAAEVQPLAKELDKNHTIENSNYNNGYKIHLYDKVINFIPLHPQEFSAWYYATVAMTSFIKESGITDKNKRVAMFESMVAMFRMTLPIVGSSSVDIHLYNNNLLMGTSNLSLKAVF